MLADLLKSRNMTAYQLSKKTGVSYGFIHKLINNGSDIGLKNAKKIADTLNISLDRLYDSMYSEDGFMTFRNNLQHMIKRDESDTILYIINNEMIQRYMDNMDTVKALYTLAALDFLCKKNGYGIIDDYEKYRKIKLKETFYPTMSSKDCNNGYMEEFAKYNICEVSLYDVC